MSDSPYYRGEVYKDAVKMATAAVECGSVRTAEETCAYIEAAFTKLLEVRGLAVPFDEADEYQSLR